MSEATVTSAVLTQIGDDIHMTATEKGFWIPSSEFLQMINTKLLLIVSEVIEAMDVLRSPYPGEDQNTVIQMTEEQRHDLIEELADVVIRTFDLARYFGPNFGEIILTKMEKNRGRPNMHGKRF